MAEKMLDSTQPRMRRSSINPPSIYGNDSYELVWESGHQIIVHGGSNKRPASTESGYIFTPFKQHCLSSSTPLKKPRIHSNQITPPIKNVLRPSLFLKSTNNENSATTSMEYIIKATKVGKTATTSSKTIDHESVVIDSSKGSHGFRRLKGKTPLVSGISNQVSFVARSMEPLPEATGHKSDLHGSHAQYYNQTSTSEGLGAKVKAATNLCNEPLLQSSSVCSLGASNNTNLCSMKNEETDESTYLSDNGEEQEVVKEKPAWEGKRIRVKRRRDTKIHSLNERKRRDKINKKMRVLKELIPNCNKVDQASMLDDAIKYLKTLKFQLQIMSMSRGLYMPLMMLPSAAQQLMGAGMGFRSGTNIPQYPIPPLPPCITDNSAQMFGFPNQMPPMPMPHAPFMPMFGNPSTQPIQPTKIATNLGENLASVPKSFYLDGWG
ncbi:hypothetical protein Lal_00047072 [Lupinus albus]|uniref:Putative transcription factor bHLH family n=1 Tax=Lupinus albus TaxID=3870 RepID=A0A6A4QZ14_LUPAL|nr:putative transcription factor bHLH family [Lupinus albus]KAF1878404.1 hypothetical protein Lal_00047072 [Lupinus albus]